MLTKPVIEIAPRTWLISEYKLDNMYLLEGDTGALLIDCGAGIGNAAETVRGLTDKPVTVAITHGHFDHDGAAALFGEIHIHPLDIALSEQAMRRESRRVPGMPKAAAPCATRRHPKRSCWPLCRKTGRCGASRWRTAPSLIWAGAR